MEEKKGFGETLNTFFAGKGFYIVLLLCAGLIATSIWLMASGSRADVEAAENEERVAAPASAVLPESGAEESGTAGAGTRRPALSIPVMEAEDTELTETPVSEIRPEEPEVHDQPAPARETAGGGETEAPGYFLWPVSGPVERDYSVEALSYDKTMSDWRTHAGMDLGAAQGSPVLAVNNGTVTRVYTDEMLGTVVEIDHGSGLVSVYANLGSAPAVSAGQRVSVGDTVGTVGETALGEIGEASHVHFAMRLDGQAVDPADWLPER